MSPDFHSQEFSGGTKLKLDIFRKYIREWISVFMTDSPKLSRLTTINIFDFFSGPGVDGSGNPGSPVIIVDEIKKYCESRGDFRFSKELHIYFNDKKAQKIDSLRTELSKVSCDRDCCHIEYSSKPFTASFEEHIPDMRAGNSANLVIMDQFGIKEVTPKAVKRLADCSSTDVLFFIPSSHIHRFREHPAFVSKIDLSEHNVEYHTIHRDVCEYYRGELAGRNYYLAPFSIKDGAQIHGIVFGSGHLYGLEKFLNVCWSIDSTTGEANYPIDKDLAWSGQMSLFAEDNVIRKIDLFENDLRDFVENTNPTNLEMYRFVLTRGFTPKKARESLSKLQDSGWLEVEFLTDDGKSRKRAFYLNHKEARVRFMKEGSA